MLQSSFFKHTFDPLLQRFLHFCMEQTLQTSVAYLCGFEHIGCDVSFGSVVMWVLEFGHGARQDLQCLAVQTDSSMPAAAMSCCRFSAVTPGLFLTTCHLFPGEAGRTFWAFAVFPYPVPRLNKTVIDLLNLMDSSLIVTISATYNQTRPKIFF